MRSKEALDTVISKSRVHFYKPIQVAEILYQNRVNNIDVSNLEGYRSISKRWRDDVSRRLVGSVSTSSSRFQDNLFDANAMPEALISEIADYNRQNDGIVEAYIYRSMIAKMNDLGNIHSYITGTSVKDFTLGQLLELFSSNPGLRRSMDKVYEIIAYALFDTIIEALDVTISLALNSEKIDIQSDFVDFTDKIFDLGGDSIRTERAKVFRVGATNANDGGLDLWSNFGPAIQVKHFTINPAHVNSITSTVKADKFIIVCTDAEKEVITSILTQSGTISKVQSIITFSDLEKWYQLSTSAKYADTIGLRLIETLLEEFEYEFPSNGELPLFIAERGYDRATLEGSWAVEELTA